MTQPTRSRSSPGRSRRRSVVGSCGLLGLLLVTVAWAQYTYDPQADDEQMSGKAGIRYFGSAKDDRGSLLPDVTFQIGNADGTFIFVTDYQGRFHGMLPFAMPAEKVTAKCFRNGYQQLRVSVRPGPSGPRQTVQVDCVLHAASPHQAG